jgi:hypothetical protein
MHHGEREKFDEREIRDCDAWDEFSLLVTRVVVRIAGFSRKVRRMCAWEYSWGSMACGNGGIARICGAERRAGAGSVVALLRDLLGVEAIVNAGLR